jgi:hypothetical protein
MRALLVDISTFKNIALLVNDEMISDILPTIFGNMPPFDIVHGNLLRGEGGRTMKYNLVNWSCAKQ